MLVRLAEEAKAGEKLEIYRSRRWASRCNRIVAIADALNVDPAEEASV
jgi:hypothetical protein